MHVGVDRARRRRPVRVLVLVGHLGVGVWSGEGERAPGTRTWPETRPRPVRCSEQPPANFGIKAVREAESDGGGARAASMTAGCQAVGQQLRKDCSRTGIHRANR